MHLTGIILAPLNGCDNVRMQFPAFLPTVPHILMVPSKLQDVTLHKSNAIPVIGPVCPRNTPLQPPCKSPVALVDVVLASVSCAFEMKSVSSSSLLTLLPLLLVLVVLVVLVVSLIVVSHNRIVQSSLPDTTKRTGSCHLAIAVAVT